MKNKFQSQKSLDSALELKTVRVYESVDDQKLQNTAKKLFIKKNKNEGFEVFFGIADKSNPEYQLNRFNSTRYSGKNDGEENIPIFSNLKIKALMGQTKTN